MHVGLVAGDLRGGPLAAQDHRDLAVDEGVVGAVLVAGGRAGAELLQGLVAAERVGEAAANSDSAASSTGSRTWIY